MNDVNENDLVTIDWDDPRQLHLAPARGPARRRSHVVR
ncbi:hypothetical protein DVS28_b0042 (plasmid) [Euzebya pacifica]|uniref:Uncharacterized protein n=1 Tax=Euzebya pacifica TaxID=1608957 RepID=A0A346Y5R5_9ACTN|nr:hypothetical protein DVS28_b0042 [Euzebya pacifica]